MLYLGTYKQFIRNMRRICILMSAALVALAACNPAQQENRPDPSKDATESTDPDASKDPEASQDPELSADPSVDVSADFTPEAWYSKNFWERSDREKLGLRGPVKKVVWGDPVNSYWYRISEFNEAGNYTYRKEITTETQIGKLYKYSYDDKGRLIHLEIADGGVRADSYEFPHEEMFPGVEWDPVIEQKREQFFEYENPGKNTLGNEYAFSSTSYGNFKEPFNRSEFGTLDDLIRPGLSSIRYLEAPNLMEFEDATREYREEFFRFGDDGNLTIAIHSYFTQLYVDYEDLGDGAKGILGWHEGDVIQDYGTVDAVSIGYKDGYPVSSRYIETGYVNNVDVVWAPDGTLASWNGINYASDGRYWRVTGWGDPNVHNSGGMAWDADALRAYYDPVTGEPTSYVETYGDWDREFIFHDYVFDTHGNWTSYKVDFQTLFDGPTGPVLTSTYVRSIEYY